MNHDLVIGSSSEKTGITDFPTDKSVLGVLFVTYLENMNDPSGLASPTANIFPMEIIREECQVLVVVVLLPTPSNHVQPNAGLLTVGLTVTFQTNKSCGLKFNQLQAVLSLRLIDGCGVVLELIRSLDDDEGRTGDQVMGFEQAVDGRL